MEELADDEGVCLVICVLVTDQVKSEVVVWEEKCAKGVELCGEFTSPGLRAHV